MLRLNLIASYHYKSIKEVSDHTSELALILTTQVLIESIDYLSLFIFVITRHYHPKKIFIKADVHTRIFKVSIDALVFELEWLLTKIDFDCGQFASKRNNRE